MSLVPLRTSSRWKEWSPSPRWKEWIPLITQQQRLRNLIQIAAYNVPWHPGSSMYFTLHQTVMSPPFYTSERLQHQHPKWGEIDVCGLSPSVNLAATGVVIRLWLHRGQQNNDVVVLVWGLHFSGLIYLGPRLNTSASYFNKNCVMLHMQGGYFTDHQSVKVLPANAMVRNLSILLPISDTRPSYSISLLLRLRNIQHAIKKMTVQSGILREKILAGGMSSEDACISRESNPIIRKLLSKGRPKPQEKQETMAALCQVEMLRFRVALLREEKLRKLAQLESLEKQQSSTANENADRSCELTERYQNLHKEVEQLRAKKLYLSELREMFVQKNSQLSFRRKHLMSQLSHIYPVTLTDGKYTISGIHLPNSEELTNADDLSVSVALGFVAHLVQMVSIFLQVPLRYPIINFGSRSKIVDYVSDKIPERDREFPLFSRGKDKLQFHYGVYLLNKNIAQLRWQVGFPTLDLRATLHNVYHLLHLNQFSTLENHHRSMSGSSLDVVESSVNVSPVGSVAASGPSHGINPNFVPNQPRTRHRSSKSIGSTEHLLLSSKRSGSHLSPPPFNHVGADNLASSANLSYSLDKGLDEYEEIKKSEDAVSIGSVPCIDNAHGSPTSNLASVGSEPNLVIHSLINSVNGEKQPSIEVKPINKAPLSNQWRTHAFSEDTRVSSSTATATINDKSEFTFVTEKLTELAELAHLVNQFDVNTTAPDSMVQLPTEKAVLSGEVSPEPIPCDLVMTSNVTVDLKQQSNLEPTKNSILFDRHLRGASSDFCQPKHDVFDLEVDVGTDALASISSNKTSNLYEFENGSEPQFTSGVHGNMEPCNQRHGNISQESEKSVECVGVEESVLVDNLFASVTSRTEALANHTTSFNLMSSRHGSM